MAQHMHAHIRWAFKKKPMNNESMGSYINKHTCSNWNRRPLFEPTGFVAFELQHAVGKSLVDISSELTDRIDVVSVAGPLRIFKSFWFCIEPGGGSRPGLHFPFHIFFCFCFLRLNIFTFSIVLDLMMPLYNRISAWILLNAHSENYQ